MESWEQLAETLAAVKTATQRSEFGKVERLLGQAEALISQLQQTPLTAAQKEEILSAYRQLSLIVTAQQQEADSQLTRMRNGKRALSTYRQGH